MLALGFADDIFSSEVRSHQSVFLFFVFLFFCFFTCNITSPRESQSVVPGIAPGTTRECGHVHVWAHPAPVELETEPGPGSGVITSPRCDPDPCNPDPRLAAQGSYQSGLVLSSE